MSKKITLNEFFKHIDVARTTAYRWIMKYADELKSKGLIEIKRRGAVKRVFVNDEDAVVEFFKNKGIYLKEEEE